MTPFPEPWMLALFVPSGAYRVVDSFADREAALAAADGNPDLTILFKPLWREQARRRRDDY